MAIRDNFRRAFRRSVSSGSSQTDSNSSNTNITTTSSEASERPSLYNRSSRLTWKWSSKDAKERKDKTNTNKKRVIHPSERKPTAQNLVHQEMLSHFTMTFGASRPEQIETESFVGISPCCTRTPSLAGDESDEGSATSQLLSETGSGR